jgi:glycosyltransferase involved in cell wall biosynthesis
VKILFSTDQIYLHGGIEKVMAEKANYFANLPGVEVFILTTEQKGNPPCYPLNSAVKLMDMGIDYERTQSYFSKANLRKVWKHFRKQKSILSEIRPDVIISPNYNFDHYWLPFIKGKAKLIKERHASRYREGEMRKTGGFSSKLRRRLNDWVEAKYNHIVVLNPDEKKYVKTANAIVIPNPMGAVDFISPLVEKQVLAAGRIAPVKGFDELIEIWAMIRDEFPDWELHIYGDDYLGTQSKLETRIKEYNLEKEINFKGTVKDLRLTMKEYSIYAMTSETECFPMVLLESLSVGLPIVSYDCPNGPRNIIQHQEDGFLVENKNRNAFADALRNLMNSQELRNEMGKKAKENAQRFTTESVMKQWKKLLDL